MVRVCAFNFRARVGVPRRCGFIDTSLRDAGRQSWSPRGSRRRTQNDGDRKNPVRYRAVFATGQGERGLGERGRDLRVGALRRLSRREGRDSNAAVSTSGRL